MGYTPPTLPPRLNLDRHGMPKDYATYVWLLYKRHVEDESPARRAFLYGPTFSGLGSFDRATATLYTIAQIADVGNQLLRQVGTR